MKKLNKNTFNSSYSSSSVLRWFKKTKFTIMALIIVSAKWERCSDHNVGANLMFALELKMFANNVDETMIKTTIIQLLSSNFGFSKRVMWMSVLVSDCPPDLVKPKLDDNIKGIL